MATRKIRFSWISDFMDGVGAQLNLSFEGQVLETGLEIASTDVNNPIVKEYEFDLNPGTYNFVLEYINDAVRDDDADGIYDHDRNLKLVKFEIANDGINYEDILVSYNQVFENAIGSTLVENYIYTGADSLQFSGDNRDENNIATYTLPIVFTE